MRTPLLALALAATAAGAALPVGPGQPFPTPCAAIAAARPLDTIEIHPASYPPETCTVTTPHLTIRAAATPRPSLPSTITIAAPGTTIEGLEIHSNPDAAALQVGPGAGLTLRNCFLHDNLTGLAAADSPQSEITVESTEFARNTVNIDIGAAARLTLRFSYSHHAGTHLVRSRALENHILYNRLTQESGSPLGLLAFPAESRTYLTGNLIERQAGSGCANPLLRAAAGELVAVHNTFVNGGEPCEFLEAGAATAELANNIFHGPGQRDAEFAGPEAHDYHLRSTSHAINAASDLAPALQPEWEYVHPLSGARRRSIGPPDLGAYEFGSALESGSGAFQQDDATPDRAATGPEALIALSSGSAPPGGTADVNLFLFNFAASTAAAQWTFTYPAGAFTSVSVRPGPSALKAGKTIHCTANDGRSMSCLVMGYNTNVVDLGIVAIASFKLAANATAGSVTTVNVAGSAASTPPGDRIPSRTLAGRVTTVRN